VGERHVMITDAGFFLPERQGRPRHAALARSSPAAAGPGRQAVAVRAPLHGHPHPPSRGWSGSSSSCQGPPEDPAPAGPRRLDRPRCHLRPAGDCAVMKLIPVDRPELMDQFHPAPLPALQGRSQMGPAPHLRPSRR
jgi:hypothetical protein